MEQAQAEFESYPRAQVPYSSLGYSPETQHKSVSSGMWVSQLGDAGSNPAGVSEDFGDGVLGDPLEQRLAHRASNMAAYTTEVLRTEVEYIFSM